MGSTDFLLKVIEINKLISFFDDFIIIQFEIMKFYRFVVIAFILFCSLSFAMAYDDEDDERMMSIFDILTFIIGNIIGSIIGQCLDDNECGSFIMIIFIFIYIVLII